jgi:WXG100 family type VII secretion target
MGYLKVDIAAAKQIATDLKHNAEARTSDLSALGSRVRPDNIWEGEAAVAYQEKYEAWRSAETQLVEALRQLGLVVDRIITNFDDINTQGAAALR